MTEFEVNGFLFIEQKRSQKAKREQEKQKQKQAGKSRLNPPTNRKL